MFVNITLCAKFVLNLEFPLYNLYYINISLYQNFKLLNIYVFYKKKKNIIQFSF